MIEMLMRQVRRMRAFLSIPQRQLSPEEQREQALRATEQQVRELARRVNALDSQTLPPEVVNGQGR